MANFNIDYLVIAGGGGGASASSGNSGGGAGGAGGYRTSYGTGNISGGNSPVESALNLTIGTSYTITVGDGGAGGPAASPINRPPISGTKGDNSVFASITSEGGGYGEGANLAGSGGSGGSAGGGGGGSSAGSGGTGTSSQGSNGGAGTSTCVSNSCNLGGGGGGASQAGSSVQDGKGGDGLSSSITGSSVIRAGGGSGGSYGPIGWNDPIAGGAGGGGAAGVLANGLVGQPGTTNTGGGGGGATWYTNQNSKKGGDGGSGIVILRYTTTDVSSYTTTGITPTEDTTTIPGQTILSFTTVGTSTIAFTAPPPPPFSGTKVTTPVTDFNKPNTKEGLKIPSGTSSNQPTGFGSYTVDGMIRNDTTISSNGSSSAITYYNGTNWRYFAATESADPLVYSTFAAWDVGNTISYGGTGNTLYNIVNNPTGFNFTKYGGVSYDSTNKSFSFNGATGSNGAYMRFSQNAMNIPTGFTVSMWVNFTAFPTSSYLFAYGYSPSLRSVLSSTQMRYWLTPGPSGNYTPYFNHGMTTGNWYNVTMVINNSNAISPTTVKTYISQEGDSTATLKQTVNTSHGAYQNTNDLYFGCNVSNYNSNFNGQLRVMEIYNSELNQTDIDFIVNQGSQ